MNCGKSGIIDKNGMAPTGMNEDETVIEILEKFEAFKKWAKTKIETL